MNFRVNPKIFLAELIGTFALVFIGAGAAAVGKTADWVAIALAHGLVLSTFIYAYGSVSGAHFNPAVTFGLALNEVIKWTEAVYYWVAQILASVLAATALFFILNGSKTLGQTVPASGVNPLQAVLVETLITFLLVTVIYHTAVAGKGKDFTGLVIGLTLACGILFGGPLTGGSMNPARSLGPALYSGTFIQYWIYLVGPLVGAALAAFLYRYMGSAKKSAEV